MEKRIKRRIGALVILGMLVSIALVAPVQAPIGEKWDMRGNDAVSGDYLGTNNAQDLDIRTSGNSRMVVTAGGVLNVDSGTLYVDNTNNRVGIGDTSPDFKLEVTGSSGDDYFGVSSTDDNNDNGDIFKIDDEGKVGIGTASPGAKLDVEVSSGGAATLGSSNCVATGDYSVAMGDWTSATEDYAVAMGYDTTASGLASVAMGNNAIASNQGSFANGYLAVANGVFSTANGWMVTSSGMCSHAIGSFITAGPSIFTHVIGVGWDNDYRIVNNIAYSLMVGYNSDTPTLFVGPSDGIGTTGNISIATTSPTAKVHIIQTDDDTDAFRIDDADSDNTPFVIDKDGRVGIGTASPGSKLEIKSSGTQMGSALHVKNSASTSLLFVRDDGNVGIGVTNPNEKLEIDGNILFNWGQDRKFYVETPSGNHRDGDDLTIKAGNGYFNPGQAGSHGYDGGNLYLSGGDGCGAPGGNGGNTYLYGGAPDVLSTDGNVILAHTGTVARGNVGIGTANPQRALHVVDVIRLEPRGSAPSSPSEGDIYVNSSDYHIYCYLNDGWKPLDNEE